MIELPYDNGPAGRGSNFTWNIRYLHFFQGYSTLKEFSFFGFFLAQHPIYPASPWFNLLSMRHNIAYYLRF